MKKTKKVLVTGVAGFIGFHLANELLAQGWSVAGVDSITDYYDPRIKQKRLSILKKYPAFRFYKANIANFSALEKILKKEKPDMKKGIAEFVAWFRANERFLTKLLEPKQ